MRVTDLAEGKWDLIFKEYGIPMTTGNNHYEGPCPLCQKKKKFRLFKDWIKTGSWICVCGSGKGIQLIMEKTGQPFNEVAKKIYELLDYSEDDFKKSRPKKKNKLKALNEFNMLKPIKGSTIEDYLLSRDIYVYPHKYVRFSPMEYYGRKSEYPAMVAMATTESGELAFKHCTYIVGGVKIPQDPSKKMFKVDDVYDNSVCVRMFSTGSLDYLGVAEGIETALSAAQMKDMPVWSTLNSIYLKKFKAPKGIRTLHIFADNDSNGTGLHAAFECGRNNILKPNDVEKVVIHWPKERGDFNDMLCDNISEKTMKWILNK